MSLKYELEREVKDVLITRWLPKESSNIPEVDDIKLWTDAKRVNATVLCADISASTDLVRSAKREFCTQIYKSFFTCVSRIVRANAGEIVALQGDRLMAVFLGKLKNTAAAKAALQINFSVHEILNRQLRNEFPENNYAVRQCVGIDSGELYVTKIGIRRTPDLLWIGTPSNVASKMCELREDPFSTYITEAVFNSMLDEAKYGGTHNELMWGKYTWEELGLNLYRSNWMLES